MSKRVKDLLTRISGDSCVSGVLSILADDMNPANDFNLKETMQSMTRKQCEQFWSQVYQTIDEINRADVDMATGNMPIDRKQFSEKELEFFEAIQKILSTVLDNDISGCPSMDLVLGYIHEIFFSLTDEMQESYCRIFEKIWIAEMDFRETYIPNMCTYLMTMAMSLNRSFNSYMTRLNAVRDSFKLIDFTSSQSNTLKALILRSIALPQFINHTHGKRLLSIFLSLSPTIPRESLIVLKDSLLSLPTGIIRKWGDILMTSDIACEDVRIRESIEKDVIQECLNLCIHASNQRVFIATKSLLGSFVHYRKNKELWNRLTELYEPVLFRSLTAVNARVRRHAVIVFTDCFPLGSSESRESYSIEEQFKSILVLCDDDCTEVRSVAVAGILHLIANYYELLPVSVTTMIFDHFTQHLLYDSQVEVREYCLRGIMEVLDNRVSYQQLFPRLYRIWNFLFDKSLRVRRVFLQLLVKLQNIKSFDMDRFLVLDDFLQMMVYDQRCNPTNSLNKLYVKFLYPLFWQEKENARVVKRVHNFLVKDAKACSVFISQSSQSAGVDATLKLTRLLLISLFLCYEGAELDSSPSVTHPVPKQTKKGHGRKRNAAEISGAETSTEQAGDSFETNVIPAGDREFQKSLLHVITVLFQRLRSVCTSEELDEGSVYLLSDITSERLLAMYGHCVELHEEDDFLCFLSFFKYQQIETVSPQFMSVLLSSSQELLSNHLALFMQLIYQWDIGAQILEVALQQIESFLKDPSILDSDENCVNVEMKRRKIETKKKKRKTKKERTEEETTQIQISLSQSLAVLQAVVNDSISQNDVYSPEVLIHIQSILAPTLSVLQSYVFPAELVHSSNPSNTLQIFYSLVSLLLKIETHQAVSTLLKSDKQIVTGISDENTQQNALIGAVPSSLKELRLILSNQILTINRLGNYQLSLLHLLLSYASKCASLLLLDSDFTESCFSLLRSVATSLFSSDLQEIQARIIEHRVMQEEESSLQTMQQFMVHRILPLAGKWLQAIRTVSVSLSVWESEMLLLRLLQNILTVFPLEAVMAMENELVPLLCAYPRVLQEVIESEIRELRSSISESHEDLPSVMSKNESQRSEVAMKRLYVRRCDMKHDTLLLHILLTNVSILNIVCENLSSRLRHCGSILDLLCVLSVLLLCIEVREHHHLRVPKSCYGFLDEFLKEYQEKYKETLSAGEEDEARKTVQFIVDVTNEIQRKAKQIGQEIGKKRKVGKKGKKNTQKRRVPEKLDVIEEEEEVEGKENEEEMKEEKQESNNLPQSVPDEPSEIQLDQPPDEVNEVGKVEEPEILEIPEKPSDISNPQPEEPLKISEDQKDSDSDSFFDEPEYLVVC